MVGNIPPDPEMDRSVLAQLKAILDNVKVEVKVLILDRDSLRRERNTALQALADAVCHDSGPATIRMDPQRGLQGWCTECECWHCWADWEGEHGWGGTEDRDSPGGSPL